jgi:hypothetical protein
VAARFEQNCRVRSKNVGPLWKLEASGKPCGVFQELTEALARNPMIGKELVDERH